MLTLLEFGKTGKFLLAAHRGSSGTAPENTLAAFTEALDAGVNMIEVDIQLTKDRHPVIYHDLVPLDLPNTIENLNLAEVQSVDLGARYDQRFAGQRIPLLEDVLKLIANKAYLLAELKMHDLDDFGLNLILDTIKKYGYKNHTLVASFHYSLLKKIKAIDSEFHTAAIKIPYDPRKPSNIIELTGCDAFIIPLEEVSSELMQNIREHNIHAGIYPIDTMEDLSIIDKYEIMAIGTNYPAKIREELVRRGRI